MISRRFADEKKFLICESAAHILKKQGTSNACLFLVYIADVDPVLAVAFSNH